MADWKQKISGAELSDQTKKFYVGQIERLLEETQKPIEWILSHPDETIEALGNTDYSLSTKRNRVSSICALFKYWGEASGDLSPEREKWCAAQKAMNKQSMDRVLEGVPTEREIVNWVPWNKVLDMERFMRKSEFASQRHLLLAMYTHMEPMRSDFGNVTIHQSQPPDQCTANENWIFLSSVPHQSTICLNQYKTHNKYGRFTRTVPESLVMIIRKSLIKNPRSHLFVSRDNQPYTKSNSFTKYANRTLYQIFGKHMSISLLRHSFISAIDFNKSTPGDLMSVSKNMMHSLSMQQMYRRAVPELSVNLDREDAPHYTAPLEPRANSSLYDEKKKRKKKKKKRKHAEQSQDMYHQSGSQRVFIV